MSPVVLRLSSGLFLDQNVFCLLRCSQRSLLLFLIKRPTPSNLRSLKWYYSICLISQTNGETRVIAQVTHPTDGPGTLYIKHYSRKNKITELCVYGRVTILVTQSPEKQYLFLIFIF